MEIDVKALQAAISKSMSNSLAQPPMTEEEIARDTVSSIDMILRQHGGSAEYVGCADGIVHMNIRVPPALRQLGGDKFNPCITVT